MKRNFKFILVILILITSSGCILVPGRGWHGDKNRGYYNDHDSGKNNKHDNRN